MTGSEYFYNQLPCIYELSQITHTQYFLPVPPDWQIVITDVVDSTTAVTQGKYKAVNLIGASTIAVVLNISRPKGIELPFIFGGDGATLLIPPLLCQPVLPALWQLKEIARQAFALQLRAGIVPVEDLPPDKQVMVAKLQISPNYAQAIIRGGGVAHATQLLKQEHSTYELGAEPQAVTSYEIDFSGLECRWQDIPSPKEEVLTLIISALANSRAGEDAIYQAVLNQIQAIYGDDHRICPVTIPTLHLSFSDRQLSYETRLRTSGQSLWTRWLYLWRIKLENLLGWLFMTLGWRIQDTPWGLYKKLVVEASDYRKFEDSLRLVIATDRHQRAQLLSYLEQAYQKHQLVYGYHLSDRSLMTCLVFVRHGQQVHFLDGADGGYSFAARDWKQRLKALATLDQDQQTS